MKPCTVAWIMWMITMIVFTVLALNGRWTELGLALVITGVVWYTLVPQRESGRQ